MTDSTTKTFGYIIAFLFPGLMLMGAFSMVDPRIAAMTHEAGAAKEMTVGSFLYLSTAALGLGVFVAGVRQIAWDDLILCYLVRKDVGPRPVWNEKDLRDPGVLAAIESSTENFYRFYQFYSNTSVALLIAALIVTYWGSGIPIGVMAAGLMAEIVLFRNAIHSITRHRQRQSNLYLELRKAA